ncbi:Cytochrome c, mono-and diheme variants [Modicisalibacter ilicicola DSM 19980]|uniref:Cytochrome c, mono-and diheme variants n=1 Tax=Modicisalibacter ilicicola DSM 19980 TaxID=1121942 RepID=A0A1M5BD30_9GAMM|nr:cytochrome c [Halomonas ilicicola]SHF40062.1 Cytochrome c, mono-and diheme variants [Halomonas ilicicola DSM 19980]
MRTKRVLAFSLLLLVVSGCGEETVEGRWYTQSQVDRGKTVFLENCAECHGRSAQGRTSNWREPQADGAYPPPPLNGSAHAWHHSFDMLMRTINQGGAAIGGQMPGFEDQLSEDDKEASIAYFQSQWDQRIYEAWLDRGGL